MRRDVHVLVAQAAFGIDVARAVVAEEHEGAVVRDAGGREGGGWEGEAAEGFYGVEVELWVWC